MVWIALGHSTWAGIRMIPYEDNIIVGRTRFSPLRSQPNHSRLSFSGSGYRKADGGARW